MFKQGKVIENISTVRQLRDALTQWHPDTPVNGGAYDVIKVTELEDMDTGETVLDIDGDLENI